MKKLVYVVIVFMCIGFASISFVLYLNNDIYITSNEKDFISGVMFIKNSSSNIGTISNKGKTITFNDIELKPSNNYESRISFDIANYSTQYDASVAISCESEYNLDFDIPNDFILSAGETKEKRIIVKTNVVVSDINFFEFTCSLNANAVERDSKAVFTEAIPNMLAVRSSNDFYNKASSVSDLILNDEQTITKADISVDLSALGDGSVIGSLILNSDGKTYTAYIEGNGALIANYDSSQLFSNYSNLNSITGLNKLNTSLANKFTYMFNYFGFNNNNTLDLSSWDVSSVTTMDHMFWNTKIYDIDFSGWKTSSLTNLCCFLVSNSKITEIDVSMFDTSKVTNVYAAFDDDARLYKVNVSGWDTSNITNFGWFFRLSPVSEADLSNFDTSSATTMESMFSKTKFKSLDLSNFDTSHVKDMNYMFGSMTELENLNISGFDFQSITSMKEMFANDAKLNTEFTFNGNPSLYDGVFKNTSTDVNSQIKINYANSFSDAVNNIYSTKNENSNISLNLTN